MASVHRSTIVAVNSVGLLNVEPWIDDPNVMAVRGLMLLNFVVQTYHADEVFTFPGQVWENPRPETVSKMCLTEIITRAASPRKLL